MSEDVALDERADTLRPATAERGGPRAVGKFLEFFAARTGGRGRPTAGRWGSFLAWCEARGLALEAVSPLHVAAYIRTSRARVVLHRGVGSCGGDAWGCQLWGRGPRSAAPAMQELTSMETRVTCTPEIETAWILAGPRARRSPSASAVGNSYFMQAHRLKR